VPAVCGVVVPEMLKIHQINISLSTDAAAIPTGHVTSGMVIMTNEFDQNAYYLKMLSTLTFIDQQYMIDNSLIDFNQLIIKFINSWNFRIVHSSVEGILIYQLFENN